MIPVVSLLEKQSHYPTTLAKPPTLPDALHPCKIPPSNPPFGNGVIACAKPETTMQASSTVALYFEFEITFRVLLLKIQVIVTNGYM